MKEKGKTNKNKEEHQTINCDVESCTHNDGENHCELNEIQVSSETTEIFDDVEEKDETVCDSFEVEEEEEIDKTDEEEDM